MKKTNSFIVGFLFLLLLSSCNGGRTDNKQTAVSFGTASDSSSMMKALKNIYYLFPSPAEMLTTINQGGLVYKPELLNSIEKREKYIEPNDQFLNIGIYLADLSYCVLFARNDDAENYMETIQQMSNKVHLSTEIDKELIEKVKNKDNPVDSLVKITDKFYYKLVNDLEGNNRQNDVAMITTGAYIECIYLAANVVKKYSADNLIIQKIAEQKQAFNLLFLYCKKHISNQDLVNSFPYIQQINDAFGQLSEQKDKIKVKEKKGNHLIISGGNNKVVTEAQFKAFKENITKIRNTITK